MAEKVYQGQEISTGFLSDQVAGIDQMQTFLIDLIRTSKNFKELQERLTNDLAAVKVQITLSIEEFLRKQNEGFAVMIKPTTFEGPADWDRDDDGFPIIYKTKKEVLNNFGPDFEIIRILDLAEEAARRAEQK
jgi:hypothetical protein